MNITFVRVNPSGKLPVTFPTTFDQMQWNETQFPGVDDNENSTYTEKHHIGYRYFDMKNLEPMYPFGYGLSYTEFEYSNLTISG